MAGAQGANHSAASGLGGLSAALHKPSTLWYDPRLAPPGYPARETTWESRDLQVIVRDNNVDQALRALKKKMQREGIFREMKMRRAYEKPSEKRAREKAEAIRRARKLARKRAQRDE